LTVVDPVSAPSAGLPPIALHSPKMIASAHGIGLAIGAAAMLAAYLVRWYG